MEFQGYNNTTIVIEVGQTYKLGTKGVANLIVGEVLEITDEFVVVESYDYHHKIKRNLIFSAEAISLEPAPETRLDILLRQKYIRVPNEIIANEMIAEAVNYGYTGWYERYEPCDMYCAGQYETYLVQIK